jgi:pyridoxamine 5'-phosphate oxidase
VSLADERHQYAANTLDENSVAANPIEQLQRWLADAARAANPEPNAMTLATADAAGRPSARVVLLKGLDQRGAVFFTDYRSRKGAELEQNPQAALVLYWPELERQVRLVGRVERVDSDESWTYYRTRPIGSRLGAWASRQSAPLADRAALERRVEEVTAEFAGTEPPLPPHWGGYRVIPEEFEFWQGRPDRLHDRIAYRHGPGGAWQRLRLSP